MTIARAEVALRGKDETAAAFRSVVRNAETAQKRITASFRAAFGFLGAGTAIFGLTRAITGAIRAGDDLAKFAAKSGLAAEAASELAHAAKMADLDLGQLATGVRFMQRNISEAASGNKAAQATFHALGLEWQDLKRLAPDQQIEQIAEQLSRLEDPADRARAASELFGRAGADLLPMFMQGAQGIRAARQEAQELGKSFSAEDLARFQEADQAMKRLGASTSAAADQVTIKLAPALVKAMDLVRQIFGGATKEEELALELDVAWRHVQSFGKMINESPEGTRALERYAAALTAMSDFRIDKLVTQSKGLTPIGPRPPGYGDSGEDPDKAEDKIRQVIAAVEQQIATYKQGEAATLSYRIAHGDLAIELAKVGAKAGPLRAQLSGLATELKAAAEAAETQKARDAIRDLIADLEQEIATFERGEVATIEYRIAHGDLAETFARLGAEADPLRAKIIALTEAQVAAKEASEAQADAERRAAEIFEDTRTPLEVMQAQIEELQELTDQGLIDPETQKRRLEQIEEDYRQATDRMSVFWEQGMRNMQSHFADFLFDPFDKGLKGMLKGFIDVIRRMIAEAAAARIFEKLGLGSSGGGGGLFGSLLGGLFGGLGGGGSAPGSTPTVRPIGGSGGFRGFAAHGVTLGPHEWAIAGEAGKPEAVLGPSTIVPMDKIGRSVQRSVQISAPLTISVRVDGTTDRSITQGQIESAVRAGLGKYHEFWRDQLSRGAYA